jgi:hypothetical protein
VTPRGPTDAFAPRGPTLTPAPRLLRFNVTPGRIRFRRWNRHATPATIPRMATVLVDAENVRRSLWPNLSPEDLTELSAAWGKAHSHEVVIVWEGNETADDRIAREVKELEPPVWVVTSDRELRRRVEPYAERILGGGGFARGLQRR